MTSAVGTFRHSYLDNIIGTSRNGEGWYMHMTEAKEQLQRISGNNIKLSRTTQGYTQEGLAERAEISVEHLKQVERGKKMLSVESLVNVANALQVSVDSLVYEQTINSAKNDIAQMLVSIDSEDSQRLLGLIRYVNDNFLKKM